MQNWRYIALYQLSILTTYAVFILSNPDYKAKFFQDKLALKGHCDILNSHFASQQYSYPHDIHTKFCGLILDLLQL